MAHSNQMKKQKSKQRSAATKAAISAGMGGNKNALGRGAWSDALRRAVARAAHAKGQENYLIINRLADALVKAGSRGSVPALKEIGDRLDGKVVQEIRGAGENGELVTAVTVRVVHDDSGS